MNKGGPPTEQVGDWTYAVPCRWTKRLPGFFGALVFIGIASAPWINFAYGSGKALPLSEIDAGGTRFLYLWTVVAMSMGLFSLWMGGTSTQLSMSKEVLGLRKSIGPLRWTKRILAVEGIDLRRITTSQKHRSETDVGLTVRTRGEEEKILLWHGKADDPEQVFQWLQRNTNVPGEDRRGEEPLAVS
ncbi:MAG: hypothetical protein ACI9D0_000844 [Bacteroidia bacterium]|jgi:hypothetical protein